MYEKQPQLNVGYYGPSIPPFEPSYHRLMSNGRFNCCSKFFNLIFKPILSIMTAMGIVFFLYGLIVNPRMMKFHVSDATLSEFNYTSNSTLHYDLSLKIVVRNPNMFFDIYYNYIEVHALFHNATFDSKFLNRFYQVHGSTRVLNPVFKGQQVLELNTDQISELKKENASGIYKIDVTMYLETKFEFVFFGLKVAMLKPKISCNLLVPLKGSLGVFKSTKCVPNIVMKGGLNI